MKSKFDIGETSGQKISAASVAKAMMTARDNNGDRLFTSSEFLTSQQISDFFSRLAAKRSLQVDVEEEEEDSDDESEIREAEKRISKISEDVINEIVPKHPICYDHHNLCELAERSKLSTFGIAMLREICDHFDLSTEDIKTKRKAPYVAKLEGLLKMCSCCQE